MERVRSVAEKTRKLVETTRPPGNNLMGLCAIASAKLFVALEAEGIKSEIAVYRRDNGFSHVFLIVDDHVVDITATQFVRFCTNPVVILHEREADVHEFYRYNYKYSGVKSLRMHQKKHNWSSAQTVEV